MKMRKKAKQLHLDMLIIKERNRKKKLKSHIIYVLRTKPMKRDITSVLKNSVIKLPFISVTKISVQCVVMISSVELRL